MRFKEERNIHTFDNLVVEDTQDKDRDNAESGEGMDDLIEDAQTQHELLIFVICLLNFKQSRSFHSTTSYYLKIEQLSDADNLGNVKNNRDENN